jgi:hypothetical protein
MPPLIDNTASQGQPQVMQYDDMGCYNIANGHPPVHEYHDQAIDNYAPVALNIPVQAQAAPPTPVCTDPLFSAYMYLIQPFRRRGLIF